MKGITRKLKDQLRFKNIDFVNNNHFRILNDKVQNFFDMNEKEKVKYGNGNNFMYLSIIRNLLLSNKIIFLYLNLLLLLFILFFLDLCFFCLNMFPIINPGQRIKILFDFLMIFGNLILLFYYPLQIAFDISVISSNETLIIIQNAIGIYIISIFSMAILIKLNTGFYKKGKLITKREEIFKNYIKKEFFIDALLLSQLIFSENVPFLKIFKILILFKFKEIIRFARIIFDFLHLSSTGMAFFHLFQLTFCIFFFSHYMACSWHAISYYFPSSDNMLKAYNIYEEPWQTKYFKYLFLTVNPGRIDPKNNLELLFGYFALLATSGSIGFMINGIHNIMRAVSKSNEAKR